MKQTAWKCGFCVHVCHLCEGTQEEKLRNLESVGTGKPHSGRAEELSNSLKGTESE